ncbi:MAG: hypothetical protein FJW20_09030 [Acidimicrobiia bacterium]|nr:hypothetical protein [Acidimicrobiia bacterium]
MKLLGLCLLTAAAVWPAGFTDGQAARLVIGQRTFTAQEPGASATLLGAVSGLAYANNMLVVVDSNRLGALPINHRVLLFKDLQQSLPGPADEIPPFVSRCPVCTGTASVVLGQADFDKADLKAATQASLRNPMGAATDGRILAVADTDNNRVLIWNSIPQTNQTPADVVVGQPDFTRTVANEGAGFTPSNKSFRGPQGVWIQDGKLFVADTGNNRVLIFNSIPRSIGAQADVVLGQPDFRSAIQPDLTKATIDAKATTLLTPVSVSSDGVRLFVTDLGHNRVLIWNSIPTQNQQAANLVLGQPDMESTLVNNSTKLCAATGKAADGKDIFPSRCAATMDFPRFALSDGKYLFIADGGNDRILVYNSLPTRNGQPADAALGQISERVNLISDSAFPRGVSSAAAVRTPLSLAWDGTNLYASDPFNRRVMVFTASARTVPNTGVRNSASREIFAVGAITFQGEVRENDEITIKIGEREYIYKAVRNDNFTNIIDTLVARINAGSGDPQALATPNTPFNTILLTAREAGTAGDSVQISATLTAGTTIQITTSGPTLSGGQDAALIAPGTIVSVVGDGLSETTTSVPPDAPELPLELAGVQVYFDGIRAPILMVSPGEIRAQIPWEVLDAESINAYVRQKRSNGEVRVSAAIAVPIFPHNPGLFAEEGAIDPRPGLVFHGSSFATGTVSVDGSVQAGNIASVTIEDRTYSYTVLGSDTLESIRDALIGRINDDPKVTASPASAFTRIRLRARVEGPEGNGIVYSASSRDGDQVIITATTPALCCANRAGARVTVDNPALPGETLVLYATGLGLVKPDDARAAQITGQAYRGPALNDPVEFVSSLAGGKTANVLSAGLKPGTIGIYEIILELNSDLPTNPLTQVTIAQEFNVSNIVTFPLFNPTPPQAPEVFP